MRPDDPAVSATPIELPASDPPTLFVVVDTEEEFDWSAPVLASRARRHGNAPHRPRAADLRPVRDRPDVRVDYPVASKPEGSSLLAEFASSGRATIGAHLHPWVTPPHDEEVSRRQQLCDESAGPARDGEAQHDGRDHRAGVRNRPQIYKAGRYGSRRERSLAALDGFPVDTSVNPHMDYASEHGPDFRAFDAGHTGWQAISLRYPARPGSLDLRARRLGQRCSGCARGAVAVPRRRRSRSARCDQSHHALARRQHARGNENPHSGAGHRGPTNADLLVSQPVSRTWTHSVRALAGRPWEVSAVDRAVF